MTAKVKEKADLFGTAPTQAPKPKLPAKAATAAKQAKSTAVAIAAPKPPPSMLDAIFFAVKDPKCDPAKMNALLDVRSRIMQDEARVAFSEAYSAMQADLPTISADGKIEIEAKSGKRGQSTPYATYKNIQKATKKILRDHKFSMLLLPEKPDSGLGVIMRGKLTYTCLTQYGKVAHTEECRIAAPLETGGSKNNVQGVGSSLSYTKRYTVITLLDLVSAAPEDQDDDGEATSPKGGARKKQAEKNQESTVLSGKQVMELLQAIDDCDVESSTFLTKFKIKAVHELPAEQFDEAIKSCQNYKAKLDAAKAAKSGKDGK